MNKLYIKANAKINLSLSVLGRREDGYHSIDTVMQSVDICDDICLEKSNSFYFECDGAPFKSNIAEKAARLFFEEIGISPCAAVRLKKHIPAAAGLGGGSADAAGVLVGLNTLFEAEIPYARLCCLAASLGADVPFLIRGGTQRAEGIGEQLTPLSSMPCCKILIVMGGQKTSTADMFSRLDNAAYQRPDIQKTVDALSGGSLNTLCKTFGNSFSVLWDNTELFKKLILGGAEVASLSGSGPACFAVFSDTAKAKKTKAELEANGMSVYSCRPAEKSVILL